jgi:lysophospholipase L1-like esterase
VNLRRFQIWLVAVGLLLSVLANVLLIREVRVLYAERLMAQIFPSRRPQPPVIYVNAGQFSSTILLFGDSRMAAWEFPPPADTRVVNAGVNGATTAQLRLQLPQLLDEFKPDVVVLQAGINDLKLVGLRPELEEDLILQAATNLLAMADDSLTRHSKVILLLTWPPGPPEWRRRLVWNRQIPEAVVRLNERLSGCGVTNQNFYVVDLLAESPPKPSPSDYQDAWHFQKDFYHRLTPPLMSRLTKICDQH